MRISRKKMAKSYIKLLGEAHSALKRSIECAQTGTTLELLEQCQDAAIELGTMIEGEEGEGFAAVTLLEEYCEQVFQIYTLVTQKQSFNPNKVYKHLKKQMRAVENSLDSDTTDCWEAVFLPYKASMWDSLESVYLAAKADENCDVYVIPIPYFDKNPDGSVKEVHYEGDQFPDDVPITSYEEYDFQDRMPDMVFIHNPYDDYNYVTSVHPFFYSSNLRKFTEMLVYIPYYSTSGGMSDGQRSCPAYYNADYIIVQAEKYQKFFDSALPQEKLVALGSPKFDRVMKRCANPPRPAEKWARKMAGKRVYFYNTSIGGMLGDTQAFLKKMEYVFKCFEGRDDVCLLWRPHPLLESTFESMRLEYKPVYDALKNYFVSHDFGIYDDTPDITDSIAWSDAYIGDSATSVTSLFGLAGKPLFILDNNINSEPKEDDWRGQIVRGLPVFHPSKKDAWMVTQGNMLYHAADREDTYHAVCRLSDYAYGNYYGPVLFVNGKIYVCPFSAQDILEVDETGIRRKILLEQCVERPWSFYGAAACGDYIFLLPNQYPAIVRYDTATDEIRYYREHTDIVLGMENGERRSGGFCVFEGKLYVASAVDNRVLMIDGETGEEQVEYVNRKHSKGCMTLRFDEDSLWLLPYEGFAITRWNPRTREIREYTDLPENLRCARIPQGYECTERPFNGAVFCRNYMYISPNWANMYLRFDKDSGEIREWKPFSSIQEPEEWKNGYFATWAKGWLGCLYDTDGKTVKENLMFSYHDRKGYTVDFETGECREIPIRFDAAELREHEPGFCEDSQWLQYACTENAFNSLPDFLAGNLIGGAFDRERQIRAYGEIAANHDGSSGEKIYDFVREALKKR